MACTALVAILLRPAFGSGEDWNRSEPDTVPACDLVAPGLRVRRGLEQPPRIKKRARAALRPAFGSGEDWNVALTGDYKKAIVVAPGLRVGRGLEPRALRFPAHLCRVAPGLRVGRGLELYGVYQLAGTLLVAPGLRVGRGLEPVVTWRNVASTVLRPAFGSGEDWNRAVLKFPVAPNRASDATADGSQRDGVRLG